MAVLNQLWSTWPLVILTPDYGFGMKRPWFHIPVLFTLWLWLPHNNDAGSSVPSAESGIVRSLGIPFPSFPPDNMPTLKKISLGRELFFDKRLSRNNSISCATCHDPNHGFSDPHARSPGLDGGMTERNSTTVLNVAFVEPLMWDGRAASLEEQALLPFASPVEFDLPVENAIIKLKRHGYSEKFRDAFGADISARTLAQAIATYQRSLTAGDSPFDRYLFRKAKDAISPQAQRGFEVFLRSKCDTCHLVMTPGLHPFSMRTVLFTDNKFHNIGVGSDQAEPDPGRYSVTRDPADWAAFRTPSLRNVGVTAPYFHDGSARSLADVVEFYDRGGKPNRNLDKGIQPLKLQPAEKSDLISFLESLTSTNVKAFANEETKVRPRLKLP